MLLLVGLQFSVYLTSTWQYLKYVHPNPSMDLFGWTMASVSLACTFANPVFGYWNQKTLSTRRPLTVGFALAAVGNLAYAQLPILPQQSLNYAILISRFLTGFGAGTMGLLRGFMATASTRRDRLKAVSLGTAGLTAGLSLGPVLQICFLPLGPEGFYLGPLLINTYTAAAYFMCLVCCLAVFMANCVLDENYVGIVSDEEKKADPFLVIPLFDRLAVALLFFYWWAFSGVSSTEGLGSAIAMAMYNWSSEEAVLYSGVIQTLRCVCSTIMYILLGATRVGTWDRRLHLTVGLLGFLFFHITFLPWPFYEGPLDRPPIENGTIMSNAGGCAWKYDWCDHTPRVPKPLYLVSASVVLGFSFPLVAAPCNTILSEIVGPRKQGMVQGLFALTGSLCQFILPILSAFTFELSGYVHIMSYHVVMLVTSLVLLVFLRKRLVPLRLTPKAGGSAKYKLGTMYRL